MKKHMLWIDGIGGLAVGILVLSVNPWLSELYRLPQAFIVFMGITNLAYGSYSTSLVIRKSRSKSHISILALANSAWGLLCFLFVTYFFENITLFGITTLVLEGIYVAGLGYLEWKWMAHLITDKS